MQKDNLSSDKGVPSELTAEDLDEISGGPTGDIEVTSLKKGNKNLITLPDAQEVMRHDGPK